MKKLYVGNLPYSVTEDDLKDLFAKVGAVASAAIIKDRETNRSKGFGFVEMEVDAEADAAIEQYNGQPFPGMEVVRPMVVNEARPREERTPGSSFGGGSRGGERGGYSRGGSRGGNSYGGGDSWGSKAA